MKAQGCVEANGGLSKRHFRESDIPHFETKFYATAPITYRPRALRPNTKARENRRAQLLCAHQRMAAENTCGRLDADEVTSAHQNAPAAAAQNSGLAAMVAAVASKSSVARYQHAYAASVKPNPVLPSEGTAQAWLNIQLKLTL